MTLLVSREKSLDTEIRQVEHHALVMLDGELDTATAAQLFGMFAELTREGIKHVALNLAELDFIDSTGISVIVADATRELESMGENRSFPGATVHECGKYLLRRPRVARVASPQGPIRPGKRDA